MRSIIVHLNFIIRFHFLYLAQIKWMYIFKSRYFNLSIIQVTLCHILNFLSFFSYNNNVIIYNSVL